MRFFLLGVPMLSMVSVGEPWLQAYSLPSATLAKSAYIFVLQLVDSPDDGMKYHHGSPVRSPYGSPARIASGTRGNHSRIKDRCG